MQKTLEKLIGKKVCATFESKRFNGIYTISGELISVGLTRTCFNNWSTDYPEKHTCQVMGVMTSRIMSAEEVI